MNRVQTTTISLPVKTAQRAKQLSRREGRTMSELFREAFRFYESTRLPTPSKVKSASWKKLRTTLSSISKAGKKSNLSQFIARDRARH